MSAPPWLREWVERQTSFPECLRAQDLEEHRSRRLALLETDPQLLVVGEEACFLAWDRQAEEQDTQQPIALLWARQGPLSSLRPLLEQSFSELRELPHYVACSVDDDGWRELLLELGFSAWRHFVTKSMRTRAVESSLSMREGEESDRSFFTALAASVARHTLPPEGQSELALYRRALLQRLLRLPYGRDSEHRLLIAEDSEGLKLGYLLLQLRPPHTAYVVDIGVDRNHWGSGIAQFLVLSAESELVGKGYEFYVGEISAANSRSFRVATEYCSFRPNRTLWRRPASQTIVS